MAAGETFKGSSDKPESQDSGRANKKSEKRTTPVRMPLVRLSTGMSAPKPEAPAPKPENQSPTRLLHLIAEHEHLRKQLERHESDLENTNPGKKKSNSDKKTNKNPEKKVVVEQVEETEPPKTTQPEVAELTKAPEASEPLDTDGESNEGEAEKPLAEDVVEIALDGSFEEVVLLSDEAKERADKWNRARAEPLPTVPMSEVGQPLTVQEAGSIEESSETIEQVADSPATAPEAEPAIVPDVAPEARKREDAPVVMPPVFQWPSRPHPQARTEAQPFNSMPEPESVPVEAVVDTDIEQPLPTATSGNDALNPPHNPLFTQQGIDPVFAHKQTMEAPAPPVTVERVVHHRPSDFWPGVLVGGAIEHIRHKRRERKMEKSQKLQQSRIAQLEYTQRRTALEQQTESNNRLRAEDAARYEKPVAANEVFPMPLAAEQLKAEQQPAAKQLSPEQPVAAEEVKPLEGHHIEKSTWHKIEVDDRTGHVAETSNIVYGEAFQRELRPEQIAAQQAQQQAEANEQERIEKNAVGVPTLPQPQVGANTTAIPPEPTVRPAAPSAPVQRSKMLRPALQSSADTALWGGLVLVVLAIIAALTL